MKQYNKPTVNVVELSVRENIAALPKGVTLSSETVTSSANNSVTLTTYNLTSVPSSVM